MHNPFVLAEYIKLNRNNINIEFLTLFLGTITHIL